MRKTSRPSEPARPHPKPPLKPGVTAEEALAATEEYLLLVMRRAVRRGDEEAARDMRMVLRLIGTHHYDAPDCFLDIAWDYNVDCRLESPSWVDDPAQEPPAFVRDVGAYYRQFAQPEAQQKIKDRASRGLPLR